MLESSAFQKLTMHVQQGFVIRLLTVVNPQLPPVYAQDPDDRVLRTVFVKSAGGNTVRLENVNLVSREANRVSWVARLPRREVLVTDVTFVTIERCN